jgi:glycosyltransferase involved in cell wall biosynthesis
VARVSAGAVPPGGRTTDGGPVLRVLLLLGTSGGGVGRHVHALAAALAGTGHAVTVGGPASTERDFSFTAVGARFVAVEVRESPHPAADLRARGLIGRLARGADVVHAHGLRVGGLAALARRGRTPLVVTVHNALLTGGSRRGRVRLAYAVLERLVARRADVVLAVSADLQQGLLRLGARDVRPAVVPAPDALRPGSTPDATRAALGTGDRLVVLCVARLAEQKGLPTLLDAVSRLGPPARVAEQVAVLVAGDGPLRAVLQARVEAEGLPVRLLGWRDDVADLLTAADVVVSAAVWEGQPVAVQQALRAGRPLVATDVGGTAAVTRDAALLVPADDADALAAALRRLLSDPAERDRLSVTARARAAELPTDADALAAALGVYRSVIDGVPTRRGRRGLVQ